MYRHYEAANWAAPAAQRTAWRVQPPSAADLDLPLIMLENCKPYRPLSCNIKNACPSIN